MWGSAANWTDVTTGMQPAASVPGSGNAVTIAQDAGMDLRKVGSRSKPPLYVKPGLTSGVVDVVAKATRGAVANEWQLSHDGGKTWVDLPPTAQASTVVRDLALATTVMFRQRVLTRTGLSDWGDPFTLLVT